MLTTFLAVFILIQVLVVAILSCYNYLDEKDVYTFYDESYRS